VTTETAKPTNVGSNDGLGGWINVRKRKPPIDLGVLAFSGETVLFATYWGTGEGWSDDNTGETVKVTHWQHVPKPPNGSLEPLPKVIGSSEPLGLVNGEEFL